ncbi:ATP-dependent DNA helicase, partial [Cesiribacter andamanensis]|uniref:ATP-dependent DNA helicase n=1 Tax=Cesiribacter andamanensis TaxID=649507 RepID=UPI00058D06FB
MRQLPLQPDRPSPSLEKLSGIVKRVTFHSAETGWSVLKVTPFDRPGEEVPVTVHQSKVFAGATIDFWGEWVNHPKFGRQFKAQRVEERKPATANALEKYLGSGLIKGVGPVTAKRIVKHFGKDTLHIFESEIERLTEVPGIAELKLVSIRNAWKEHQEIRNVMMFLQSHGISTLFAVK